MKKLWIIVLSAALLVGCNTNRTLSYEEIAVKDLNKGDQKFHEHAQAENGVYLFYDTSDDKLVIYFNTAHEGREGYAVDFTNFDVESDGDTLRILYDKNQDQGESKTFQEQQLYEVQLDKEYETIELFENGDMAAFTSIYS
ncbi:hypothetical protein CSV71_05445 [Sporosarcina sp. P21c]|uniref:hypothetical protein n=1 Tax=unclassified Sporosarcina TaxID=2647733 RepID=UPI000C164070|nr:MULTISPECIES: hypothetical protein [unclassified Sporosarcina]PIC66214.1 hypothetical protein CSV78_13655 [Sporosarcina sp. P16a]PIC90149.1 hypothetical protein CSV71_05445 [Sporosarcina sp. P21c]PIC91892.1 hypothetical protein CSV70_13405 [Sporosarcina sp. P25]